MLYFWNLDSLCRVAWQERQGLQSTKPLLNVHAYWTEWSVPPLTVTLSPDDPLGVKMKWRIGNSYLSIKRVAGLLNKAYSLFILRHQNFLINCVGVSLYYHLNWKTYASSSSLQHWYFCTKGRVTQHWWVLESLSLCTRNVAISVM